MEKKTIIRNMFDSIAGKYDLLNHLLSAGIDFYWRKKALILSKVNNKSILLDVACGTGDFAIAAEKFGVTWIFGADLSQNMIKLFNKKRPKLKGKNIQTIAELLPFKDSSFSNITTAFGVRNFYDIPSSFREYHRILKAGGKATILEFSLPKNWLIKKLYLFYFNQILPFIGRIISKDKSAYTYLPDSVKEFDQKVDLEKLFLESGFTKTEKHYLTFGIVQVVIGIK